MFNDFLSTTEGLAEVTTVATNTAVSAWAWASDFLIIIVLVTILILFMRYVGRGQLVALLLSFYGAYALYAVFPFGAYLPSGPPLTALAARLLLYGIFAVAMYTVLQRVVVSDFISIGLIGMLAISLAGAGCVIALAYHVFPVREVYTFTPAIDVLFAAKQFFWWWFIAPLVSLFVFAR